MALDFSKLVGTNDMARKIDKAPEYVRQLVREKKIPATKVGGRWYFDVDQVEAAIVKISEAEIEIEVPATAEETDEDDFQF